MTSPTYLIERIYADTSLSKDELQLRESAISVSDLNMLQLQNLIEVAGFIFNSIKCWHTILEDICAKEISESNNDEQYINQHCGRSCPWYNNSLALSSNHSTNLA